MQIRRSAVIIVLVLILLLQVGLRLPFLQVPLDRDEGAYGYIAQRILAGELPYRDAFDHKPPLIYYVYASFIKLFGNSIAAIRIPTLFYSLLTTVALFYLGFLLLGTGGGLLAAFLYAVFSGGGLILGPFSNTETFMVLPLVLALIFFFKGTRLNYFWAGLFSGMAVMFKQVAVFNFIVLLGFTLYELIKSRNKLPVLNLIGGFLIFPLVFTVYFWIKGALPDYIYGVFLVNRQYLQSLPVGLFARILHGFHTTFFVAKMENSILWLFGIIGFIYILLKGRSRQNLLLVLWALASLLAVATSGLFFGHYYIQLIPGLCLLSAYAIILIKNRAGFLGKSVIIILSVLLLPNILSFQLPHYFNLGPEQISDRLFGTDSFVKSHRLAKHFKGVLGRDKTIFVWSADPELYFYLNKRAPTKYFNYLKWMETPETKQEIVRDVLKEKPDYIVWTDYVFEYKQLKDLIRSEYRWFMKTGEWKVFKKIR